MRIVSSWRHRPTCSAVALALIVAAVITVLGLGAGAVLDAGQRTTAQQQMQRRSTLVTEAVTAETNRYLDTLQSIAASIGAQTVLTGTDFDQITAPLTRQRLAGAVSIAYMVPVAHHDVAATQASWRARGNPDLTFKPVGTGEHVFSVFARNFDGVTVARYGVDATQNPAPAHTLQQARRTGQVAVSPPYQLIIDQALPPAQRQMSFILTMPTYQLTSSGTPEFRGWVLMSLRGQDFIGTTLHQATQSLLDVTLSAPGTQNNDTVVAVQQASVTGERDLHATTAVTVGNQTWHLGVNAVGSALPGGDGALPSVVAAGISLGGWLLAVLIYVLATGRARAQARVRHATAELTTSEARAREQSDLLTAILNSISDGVGVIDADGNFLLHNPAATTILGLDSDTNGADTWQQHYGMFRTDGHAPFPQAEMPLVRALAGEATDHIEMLIRNAAQPDGLIISVSGRPLTLAAGRTGAVAVFHDITARKAVEAERAAAAAELATARNQLQRHKTYLVEVLDALKVTVITCDADERIVHTNQTGGVRLNQPDTIGRTVTDIASAAQITTPDGIVLDLRQTPMQRALRGEHDNGIEVVMNAPDGGRRAVIMHATALHDSHGQIIGAVGSAYDITALREREAELRAFAGIAAHDLKAPLAAVAGYAEIIDHDIIDGSPAAAFRPPLRRITASVARMARLIDDLLTYATARDAPLHREPVDLQTIVADVVTERTGHLRAGNTGEATLFPDIYTGPLPVINADPAMIRQLLDNLLGNALKYTLPGQPARIDISAHQRATDDGWVRVTIADRGIGIPTDEQPHVFSSFHRVAAHTKSYNGTGLGLAICQRITERHGGTITASDNPGGGTRIHLTLPTTTATMNLDLPHGGHRNRIEPGTSAARKPEPTRQ